METKKTSRLAIRLPEKEMEQIQQNVKFIIQILHLRHPQQKTKF